MAGCLALAVLSLLGPRQTTYDPTAWLIWGRDIVRGDLSTVAGPSWKPLPILVTAPAGLLGLAAQEQVWLVVARAGGLLALVLAFRLGRRLGGVAAGVIAAVSLGVSLGFLSFVARGNSEGLLAALSLAAVETHLTARRRATFALVLATGLLRPEMWLIAAGYGLWLAHRAPREERARTLALVAAAGAVLIAAWLVPEKLGSGSFLRAASRAREPVSGSPAQAGFPFGATFTNAADVLPWPLYVGGLVAVLAELPPARAARRSSVPLALAGIATLLMVAVAALAQGGFTGNSRYLVVPVSLVGVLAGLGWARGAAALRAGLGARRAAAALALAAVVAAPFVLDAGARTVDELDTAAREMRSYADLVRAIAAAGGPPEVRRCGAVVTAAFDTQEVARDLGLHQRQVALAAAGPATMIARRGARRPAVPAGATVLAGTRTWLVASTCRRR